MLVSLFVKIQISASECQWSVNILRVYEVLAKHLAEHPEEREKWPNFSPERKPILAMGAIKPLEGGVHSAQYFHGR